MLCYHTFTVTFSIFQVYTSATLTGWAHGNCEAYFYFKQTSANAELSISMLINNYYLRNRHMY